MSLRGEQGSRRVLLSSLLKERVQPDGLEGAQAAASWQGTQGQEEGGAPGLHASFPPPVQSLPVQV